MYCTKFRTLAKIFIIAFYIDGLISLILACCEIGVFDSTGGQFAELFDQLGITQNILLIIFAVAMVEETIGLACMIAGLKSLDEPTTAIGVLLIIFTSVPGGIFYLINKAYINNEF